MSAVCPPPGTFEARRPARVGRRPASIFLWKITSMPTMYGIPNCDTVRMARDWLQNHDVAFEFHDFKKSEVPRDALAQWTVAIGWEKLVNRRGLTWRKLAAEQQLSVCDAESACALMRSHPSVIKRPVMDWGETATPRFTVGFDPELWNLMCTNPLQAR